jgi:type II secretory pathway component GspD/PulD (secretin)/tetratricopeptide (TPR) repeat protein
MTKAAFLTLASSILLAAAPSAWSQAPADETAVNEAVYRQANRITLRQKLTDAKGAQDRRQLVAAAKMYDEAWELVQKIGSGIDAERAETIAGLTAVRMQLAKTEQSNGDLVGANAQINDVLRVDPSNATAQDFKKNNDKLLDQQKGKIPDAETQNTVPGILQEKTSAQTLVQDGRLLFELGKYDEAEVKLKQALRIDPNSQAALYYLSLCADGKYTQATKARAVTAQQNLTEVVQDWANPVKRELLPVPNPYTRTNLTFTSAGRQNLLSKLDRIRLDNVKYDGLPLSEVIISLNDEARKRDPEKRGINFLISQTADTGGATAPTPAAIGPDGQPLPVAAPEQADIGADQIKINPALTDIRLIDVLDAIVKVAGPTPIKYSIEDYAVVFTLKARDVTPLYVRTFKVDPNTFYQGLQGVGGFIFGQSANVGQNTGGSFGGSSGGGGGSSGNQNQNSIAGAIISRVNVAPGGIIGGNSSGGSSQLNQGSQNGGGGGGLNFVTRTNGMAQVSEAARDYFQALGVDLDPVRNPGKALFFNDRQGMLIVRATLQDLDMIEAAIQVLNIVPPQVTIKAKFVEVSQDDNKALGFDWYLGNWLMNNGSIVGAGGTAPSYQGANPPSTIFPGNGPAGTAITPKSTDGLITSGLRNTAPSLFTLTGILTDPQFRVVIHAVENRTGADLLASPEVTTTSGRQAEMKATDVKTIVTGFSFSQNNASSGNTAGGIGTTTLQVSTAFVFPLPEQIELGPTLDVIPSVLADGCTINLVLIPTLTEFVGYEDASAFNSALPVSAGAFPGGLVTVPTVLPLFRVRQVVSTVNVWDGQTVVLGGLIAENVATTKDKVPMIGDLPVVGRLFRSESKTTSKKNLLIFTTPTLIDPAGNRLHTDEELPFAQTSIPTQPLSTTVTTNAAPHVP